MKYPSAPCPSTALFYVVFTALLTKLPTACNVTGKIQQNILSLFPQDLHRVIFFVGDKKALQLHVI